jgi:hypothetical protein
LPAADRGVVGPPVRTTAVADYPNDPNRGGKAVWDNRTWVDRPVTIQWQKFKYDGKFRYRPKELVAYVRHVSGPSRDAKMQSLALCHEVETGGWYTWTWYDDEVEDNKRDYDMGHLIALSLGGPDHPLNCAPMLHGGNIGGDWKNEERDIAKALPGRGKSTLVYRYVKLSLTLAYDLTDDADRRIPGRFGVLVEFCGEDGKRLADDEVSDPTGRDWDNPYSKTVTNADPPERTLTLYPKLGDYFTEAEKKAGLQLKFRGAGACKDQPVPYWVLQMFNNDLDLRQRASDELGVDANAKLYLPTGADTLSVAARVTRSQRLLILAYNRWKTGGTVQSDTEKTLTGHMTFTEHKVEIDHITPAAKGGTNAYDNLQVTSRQFNNKKRDTL